MQQSTVPANPHEIRGLIRKGKLVRQSGGLASGYVQANLAVLPQSSAFDFLLFCQRNPKPCPVLEVLEAGSVEPKQLAPGANITSDIALYRVYEHGHMITEVEDVSEFWREDLVSFLLGCSFSFESALMRASIPLRHIETETIVPMFVTDIQTVPAGEFSGPMVVSMRPIPRNDVIRAVQVTSRFPSVHGSPIHIGDPSAIGIKDVHSPDMGEPIEILNDEVPVFWACGVTPQAVAMESKLPLMITHSPGHMFITDIVDEDLAVI